MHSELLYLLVSHHNKIKILIIYMKIEGIIVGSVLCYNSEGKCTFLAKNDILTIIENFNNESKIRIKPNVGISNYKCISVEMLSTVEDITKVHFHSKPNTYIIYYTRYKNLTWEYTYIPDMDIRMRDMKLNNILQ